MAPTPMGKPATKSGGGGPNDDAAAASSTADRGTKKKARHALHSTETFSCLACRKLKVRCDRQFPCSRCYRIGQECRPPPSFLARVAKRASGAGVPPTLSDLAVKGKNPLLFAQEFLGLFHERLREGSICRERAARMLKTYRESSRRAQHDVTYGILDGVSRALDLSPWELEDAAELLRDRRAGSPDVRAQEVAAREELFNSASFRLITGIGEDGVRAGSGVCVVSGPVDASFIFVSVHGAAENGIYNAADVYSMMPKHMMIAMLLFAGLICPEDRRHWFELMLHTLFSTGYRSCTRLIKALNRDGGIHVYLMTSKLMPFPDFAGGQDLLVTTCELAPKSKHVQPWPGHPHRVVNQLRHAQRGSEADANGPAATTTDPSGAAAAATAAAAPPTPSNPSPPSPPSAETAAVPSFSQAEPPPWMCSASSEKARKELLLAIRSAGAVTKRGSSAREGAQGGLGHGERPARSPTVCMAGMAALPVVVGPMAPEEEEEEEEEEEAVGEDWGLYGHGNDGDKDDGEGANALEVLEMVAHMGAGAKHEVWEELEAMLTHDGPPSFDPLEQQPPQPPQQKGSTPS